MNIISCIKFPPVTLNSNTKEKDWLFYADTSYLQSYLRSKPVQVSMPRVNIPEQVSKPGVHKVRKCKSGSESRRRLRRTEWKIEIRKSKLRFRSFSVWQTLLSLLLFRVASFTRFVLPVEAWPDCCCKSWEARFRNKLEIKIKILSFHLKTKNIYFFLLLFFYFEAILISGHPIFCFRSDNCLL